MTNCLVAYDISNGKTRRALYRLLCGYGQPVQKSVFRCTLDGSVFQRLKDELADFAIGPKDSLLFETLHVQHPMSPCLLVR